MYLYFKNDDILLNTGDNSLIHNVINNNNDNLISFKLNFNNKEFNVAEIEYCSESNCEFLSLRTALSLITDEEFLLAGKAYQLYKWHKNNKYCGHCGNSLSEYENGNSKKCESCGLVIYPQICPAIIVSVVKNGKILLAHHARFKNPIYTVLAGFVEVGETYEDCVRREVLEESNIKVKNIKYFGSQPWPFPNSLMTAFTAEYENGEIKIDDDEIVHAEWFSKEEIPQNIPGRWSIARKLIENFINS